MNRIATTTSNALVGLLSAGLLFGCANSETFSRPTNQSGFTDAAVRTEPLASRIDRGNWMVNTKSKVWKVYENQANLPERHIGYVVGSQYRQMRGGPQFRMHKITSLDRDDQVGHIDQMGRAIRYEPGRNGQFAEVPVGSSSMNENVAAIFETTRKIRIEETSEVRLAFEGLDANNDGRLDKDESSEWSGRLAASDDNNDGFIDFAEFASLDRF